jgi:SAM-dependent methyltransferase
VTTDAQTWHYGVVARWWAEFNLDGGPELEWFRRFVEAGQPALDAACGTGRLLVPYLHAGLDVDGSDISADMLELCRARAVREGLEPPRLYAQAMHELDLPRRYRTIVVCGGFGLGGDRAQNQEGLRRLYEHLEPGGTLLLDNEVPYANTRNWGLWTAEGRKELPRPWPEPGERRIGSDGAEYELRSRVVDVDPLAQLVTIEIRALMWNDGVLGADEQHTLKMSLYFKDEIVLMLGSAGFVDVQVRGAYRDEEPSAADEFVVFVARRAEQS